MKACLQGAYVAGDGNESEGEGEGGKQRREGHQLASAVFGSGVWRARGAAEGTTAQLLAPDAVGLTGHEEDEVYLMPRSKVS